MDDRSLNAALRLFLRSETYILRHSFSKGPFQAKLVLSEERSSHIYLEHTVYVQ